MNQSYSSHNLSKSAITFVIERSSEHFVLFVFQYFLAGFSFGFVLQIPVHKSALCLRLVQVRKADDVLAVREKRLPDKRGFARDLHNGTKTRFASLSYVREALFFPLC
jgi:hypothetical protein